jgi:hypothetical protein
VRIRRMPCRVLACPLPRRCTSWCDRSGAG